MAVAEPEVASAVRRVVGAFRGYALTPGLAERCSPYGDGRDIAARLERESSSTEDLANYAFKAIWTMGTVDDFKAFLPALLQAWATDRGWLDHSTDVVFQKLRAAGWRSWPREEVDAVHALLLAKWRSILGVYPTVPGAADVLFDSVCAATDDVGPFLFRLETPCEPAIARHVADLVASYTPRGPQGDPCWREIDRWLVEDGAAEALLVRAAYQDFVTEPFAGRLDYAASRLVDMRDRRRRDRNE